MEIRRDFNAAQVVILPLLVQEDDANNTHVTESHGKSLSPEKQQTRDGKLQEANVVPALPGELHGAILHALSDRRRATRNQSDKLRIRSGEELINPRTIHNLEPCSAVVQIQGTYARSVFLSICFRIRETNTRKKTEGNMCGLCRDRAHSNAPLSSPT